MAVSGPSNAGSDPKGGIAGNHYTFFTIPPIRNFLPGEHLDFRTVASPVAEEDRVGSYYSSLGKFIASDSAPRVVFETEDGVPVEIVCDYPEEFKRIHGERGFVTYERRIAPGTGDTTLHLFSVSSYRL